MSIVPLPNAEQIRQELQRLSQEQNKALELAMYVGLSRTEQKMYDERHQKIVALLQRLTALDAAS